MTDLPISQLTVQAVTRSTGASGVDPGASIAVSQLVAQSITEGTPKSAYISQLIAQSLVATTPKLFKVSQIISQVLNQSVTNGYTRTTFAGPQIVYTIGIQDTARQKAWTFDFDGHTFYVLDLGNEGAMVYDLTTQSWSEWSTQGYEGHFNMKNGFHWRDGKQVVGGGLVDGLVVALNEEGTLDEDFRPILYEIQGVVFSSTEAYLRQYNLRLVGSPGRRSLDDDVAPPVLNMQFSDDNGATWSAARGVTLTSDKSQRIEFRSLGAYRQPGRIFRLYDSGGIKFIAYVMADVEGE